MKNSIKLAVVGCSGRGRGMMGLIAEMADVEVISVCDLYPDRVKTAQEIFVKANRSEPKGYTDYRKMIDDGVKEGLDAVFCPSSWQSHVEICLYAMEAGLYVATEVGGAYSVQACWDLVHTSERTGMPCMLLENCCYGREEMAILNMVKKGLFGELVHAEGGYCHDLRSEIDSDAGTISCETQADLEAKYIYGSAASALKCCGNTTCFNLKAKLCMLFTIRILNRNITEACDCFSACIP